MAQSNEAQNEKLSQPPSFTLDQIKTQQSPIEKAVEGDIDMEAFMDDRIVIRVAESSIEGENEVIVPNVNTVNQPIIRGREQTVKRRFVEALARCRVTTYEQRVPDLSNPANIQMVPKVILRYPFSVIKDPNPLGKEWLDQILAQP